MSDINASTRFEVHEILILRSPHCREPSRVDFRGYTRDDSACVSPIDGVMDFDVPVAWLSRHLQVSSTRRSTRR